jgi:hypothetical protein
VGFGEIYIPEVNVYFKKQIGAFYTPQAVADILCEWSIRTKYDYILEPSFGECCFLESSYHRLKQLGSTEPLAQLNGCDIDQTAHDYLKNKFRSDSFNINFLKSDYLVTTDSSFGERKFDAVIGNPPYISHHKLNNLYKNYINEQISIDNTKISKRSSLWAYFLIHSLRFLNNNGRMAWILPNSLLQSDYSKKLLNILQEKFEKNYIISSSERLFLDQGTEERTIILLCDNFLADSGNTINIYSVDKVTEINRITDVIDKKQVFVNYKSTVLKKNNTFDNLLHKISEYKEVVNLGDIFIARIGLVTGANNFFILNESKSKSFNIPEENLTPILHKFKQTKCLNFTNDDYSDLMKYDELCLLVDVHETSISNATDSYLNSFPENKKLENRTFKKRSPWYKINDKKIADGFIPYMHHNGPRLVINRANITSTNSIHRLFLKKGDATFLMLIAMSMLSTFSQLSAEICGRSYGSGVLKHEIGELAKIKIYTPLTANDDDIKDLFFYLDSLIRSNRLDEARHIADDFFYRSKFGLGKTELRNLEKLLDDARLYRKRTINKG